MSPIIAREWALYNEIDEYAAEWIENLIRLRAIAPGIVDRRSIVDICPDELRGFRQVHFFAGIGVWSYSLRRAGVSDDTALWTGSCPCQPFSAAGKGTGVDDERHLWPAWFHLIKSLRPRRVYGEQVASSLSLGSAKSGRNERLRQLWGRKDALTVLQNRLEGNISQRLQDLSQRGSKGSRSDTPQFDRDSGEQTRGECEGALTSQGARFRSGRELGAGEIGCRDLRSNGASIQHGSPAGLGYPILGSNRAFSRLHEVQHAIDLILSERSLRALGSECVAPRDLISAIRATKEVRAAHEALGAEIEGEGGVSWFDSLRSDLEASDYTVWAVDTPSASSGAPHIRQRLRFCADDTRSAAGRLQHTSGDGWQQRWSEPSGRGIVSRCGADGLQHADVQHQRSTGDNPGVADLGRSSTSDGVGDSTGERSLSGTLRRIHCGEEGAGSRDGQPERSGDALGVDNSSSARLEGLGSGHHSEVGQRQGSLRPVATASGIEWVADTDGWDTSAERQQRGREQRQQPQDGGVVERMADHQRSKRREIGVLGLQQIRGSERARATAELAGSGGHPEYGLPCPTNGFWRDADWLFCRDGKWRPIGPSSQQMADGSTVNLGLGSTFPLIKGEAFKEGSGHPVYEGKSRRGMLKGYGNAIDAEATVDFIEATLEPDTIDTHALRDSTETVPCQSPLRLDKVRQRDLEDLA